MAEQGMTVTAIGGYFQLDLHGNFSCGTLEKGWESYTPEWTQLQKLPRPPLGGSSQGMQKSQTRPTLQVPGLSAVLDL